jgi:NAD-dependent dihydropyrimidine dehydrogenase PreA subunit
VLINDEEPTDMSKSSLILYCGCAYSQIIPDDVKRAVLNALESSGAEFEAVPDLCELSARRDPVLGRWANAGAIKIVACFERAVKWLFHAGGAPLPREGVEFLNMRTGSIESILGSLAECEGSTAEHREIELDKIGDWVPWFPVIDYERCANCKQCLNFCLFGVYGLSEQGQVQVQKPANCKTNCPACARVCPQKAIIFPKYTKSPFNGDEVKEEDGEGAEAGAKLSELMEGDIHDVLGRRGKSGVSARGAGEQEEASRLAKLQSALDIPSEVIESLSGGQMAPGNLAADTQDCLNAESARCNRECKGGK